MAELCQHSQPAKGKQEVERGHKQDSCHIQIIPYKVMLRQKSSGGGEKRENGHGYGTHDACRDSASQEAVGHLPDYTN